jgi:hypothetical protein
MGRRATLQREHGVDLMCGVGVTWSKALVARGLGDGYHRLRRRGRRHRCVAATHWLESSGLGRRWRRAMKPARCRRSPPPAARWYNPLFEMEMRVEHWSNAVEQRSRGATLLGASVVRQCRRSGRTSSA